MINISGAGPAGLGSAIVLARAGKQVHVHERYDRVGKRFKGDLQGLENWSLKENVLHQMRSFGLKINFQATPFHEVTLTDGKHSIQKKSHDPLFYLVKRGPFPDSLDTALQKQAEELGVTFHYRSHLPAEKADIVATGPHRHSLIASDKGLVFPTKLPNMAIGIFHDEYAFKGYSYLLVAQGYGCLCSVVFQDFHKLNACFDNTVTLAKRLVKLNLDHAHPVGGIGSFILHHPRQIGNSRYVGEAGGLQDLLWGFGIRSAISSGHLAAKSILTNQDYPQMVNKSFQNYLQAGIVNRYLWETCKYNSRTLVPFLMHLPFPLRSNFRFLYNFSPLHRLIYPFAKSYIKKYYPNSIDFNEPFHSEHIEGHDFIEDSH